MRPQRTRNMKISVSMLHFSGFSRPHCDICAFFMHKTRFYLFKVFRRSKNSPCVLTACQSTLPDKDLLNSSTKTNITYTILW